MRIIGGQYKGHRFYPPANIPARPTTDFAKEGLFNILSNTYDFEDMAVLDLFGGTGSISYEFASRGCKNITLIELDKRSLDFIRQTVKQMNMPILPIKSDVFKFIETTKSKYDLIFAGPPYPLPNLRDIPDLIFQHQLLNGEGRLILEHNPHHNFDAHPRFIWKRNYGTTIFSVFEQPNA